MAYLEVGNGPPLVLVHGTLGDFRTWNSVMGPLSKRHRVISVSLRRFFPEHWDGVGNDYLMAQHVSDVIAFIEQIEPRPVDLMGHSRGGHIAFRVAEQRPDLLRKLILAEPGGDLDASLIPPGTSPPPPMPLSLAMPDVLQSIRGGDVDGALKVFVDAIDGDGAWSRVPAAARQQLRDNIFTLLGQAGEGRKPFTLAQAAIDPHADPVHRRRQHHGQSRHRSSRAGAAFCQLADRDDRRRQSTGCSTTRRRIIARR